MIFFIQPHDPTVEKSLFRESRSGFANLLAGISPAESKLFPLLPRMDLQELRSRSMTHSCSDHCRNRKATGDKIVSTGDDLPLRSEGRF